MLLSAVTVLVVLVMMQRVEAIQAAQKPAYQFPDNLETRSWDIDSLKALVGDHKTLPPGYELQALLALSAYPELKDVAVEMALVQKGAPMESNFKITTLFGSKANRNYRILLNDAPETPYNEILLRSLPFDAQVGIIAHELGHVAYYHLHSTLQIGKWGIMYLINSDFRADHEKSTDRTVIHHGMGNQIYTYAYYVRHDPSCAELYKKYGAAFIDRFYLNDEEISGEMRIVN